jgi:hypothetical protein
LYVRNVLAKTLRRQATNQQRRVGEAINAASGMGIGDRSR